MKENRSIDEPFEPSCEQKELPYTMLRYYLFMSIKGEIGIESVPCWSNQNLSEIKLDRNGKYVEKTKGFINWIDIPSSVAVGNDNMSKVLPRKPISQPHRYLP